MVQKTISLSERAYKLLKREKKEGESFSSVIERILQKKKNPWLLMQGNFDEELWDGLEESLNKLRQENLTGSNNDE
ncbi:MAG: antitoxin VapB family protein [Promethearchaeota archaeon]